jgi:hypothetical protein
VHVELAQDGDLLPMNTIFSRTDIVELSIGESWHARQFQEEFHPFEQTAEFFWGADADSEAKTLLEIVSKAQDALSEDAVF